MDAVNSDSPSLRGEPTPEPNDDAGPFSIGSDVWPGLAKLAEECGEVIQIIGKLIATGGKFHHWSELNLYEELEKELADVQAACVFVVQENPILDSGQIGLRIVHKLAVFREWHGDPS